MGCGSWLTLSFVKVNYGYVKSVFFINIQYFILWEIDCVYWFGILILLHEVDSWPVCSSLGIAARFVLLDSLPALILSMWLLLTEVAIFVVPVHVISTKWASSLVESGSCFVIPLIGRVSSVALTARLICFQLGPSSIESSHVIVVVLQFSWGLFLSNFIHWGWLFALAFSLHCGGRLVHLFYCHGLLILLSNNRPEFWGECSLEQVHFEEVEHHGGVLPLECPERIVGVVQVILVSSSFVISIGFMAKLDNPSRMSLSLVWTAYSCLKISLKSNHKYQSCSSAFQSSTDDDHSRAGLQSQLAKW